jgi:hypothetical protein
MVDKVVMVWGFPSNCGPLSILIPLCVPYSLTDSTELSPFGKADGPSSIQKLPNIIWNPKVHYPVYKSPTLIPILRQMNPVHTTPSYFSKIHFSDILPHSNSLIILLSTIYSVDTNMVVKQQSNQPIYTASQPRRYNFIFLSKIQTKMHVLTNEGQATGSNHVL